MNILDALGVAESAAGRQNPLTTLNDLKTLWGEYQTIQSSGLDIAGMVKAKTLQTNVKALRRTVDVLDDILSDPNQAPQAIAFLESL